MSVVILCGVDKCGKTTLATHLENEYGFKYKHFGPPKDAFTEYMSFLEGIKKDDKIVIDRFHLGEPTYGVIYRGKSSLNKGQLATIERKINDLGGILIYCYDDVKNIEQRFIEEGEDFAKVEHIPRLLELYKKELKRTKLLYYYHVMKTEKDLIINGKLKQILL